MFDSTVTQHLGLRVRSHPGEAAINAGILHGAVEFVGKQDGQGQ